MDEKRTFVDAAYTMDAPVANEPRKGANRSKRIVLSVVALILLAVGVVALVTAFSRNGYDYEVYCLEEEISIVGVWFDPYSGLDGTLLDFADNGSVTITGITMSRTELWNMTTGDTKQLTITGPPTWTHPGTWTLTFLDNYALVLRNGDAIRVMTRIQDKAIVYDTVEY